MDVNDELIAKALKTLLKQLLATDLDGRSRSSGSISQDCHVWLLWPSGSQTLRCTEVRMNQIR